MLGAPPPATEVGVGGETGAYHYTGGCGGPHNYENYSAMLLRARNRAANGFVIAGEGTGMLSRVTDSDASESSSGPQTGRESSYYVLALRAGFEGRYGGFEVGAAGGYLPSQAGNRDGLVLPSAKLWLGRYGVAHGWASLLADRTLSLNRIVGLGIGHHSDRVSASLGLAASAGRDTTVIADVDVGVLPNVWLGAGVQLGETRHTWGTVLRVGLRFGDGARVTANTRPPSEEPPSRAPPPLPPAPPPTAGPGLEPSVTPVDEADAGVMWPGERD